MRGGEEFSREAEGSTVHHLCGCGGDVFVHHLCGCGGDVFLHSSSNAEEDEW